MFDKPPTILNGLKKNMLVTVNFELSITISDKKPDCVDKSTLQWIGTINQ